MLTCESAAAQAQRRLNDHGTRMQLIRYFVFSGCAFCVDVGGFQLLLSVGLWRPVAVAIAFVAGATTNFVLNRQLNFRKFGRTAPEQARTYVAVGTVLILTTMGIVELGVREWRLAPVIAKILAVGINFPLGFILHRHLTFGRGITASLRQLRRRGLSGGQGS